MSPKKEKVEEKKKVVSVRKRPRRRNSKKSKSEIRPWSDLPHDLLRLIMKRLFFADHARVSAVCKNWKSIDQVRPANQLPWLLAFDEYSCKLFDPFYKKTYKINMDFTINNQVRKLTDMKICASRCGWLLLCEEPLPFCTTTTTTTTTTFFLYSPFTKETIQLPDLNSDFDIATFSSSPTSSDCMFFVLSFIEKYTIVSTFRLGDKTWTRNTFDYYNPTLAIDDVVYFQGTFYCLILHGILATYNIAKQKWDVFEMDLPSKNIPVRYKTSMLESDGEVLLVCLFYGYFKFVRVYKLDRSQMIWVKVESLGDRALFLGCTSLSVSDSKVTKGVTNRIHFCLGEECKFISNSLQHFRTCSKSYGPLAKEPGTKIWIEPPH